jgi:1-deoxy-D-xylulose-5-phosphate reductoisomerase
MSVSAPRRVTILGATGSIGRSTLALLAEHPARFQVEALTAHRNVAALAAAARAVGARHAVIADAGLHGELAAALAGTGTEPAAGATALVEAAQRPADWVMAGIVGAAGLAPTLAALERGATVALANKEALVCAGTLVLAAARRGGATLLPVDSEHNAIFQALACGRPEAVERITLTASGGPFWAMERAAMAAVTPAQAVAHPRWSMGAKISVDSATMMNKGLEVIEAHHLFGLPEPKIEVLVHPQSVVHGMVAFRDGSILAQLGPTDMRVPIAHALAWPDRLTTGLERLDLARLGRLDFLAPDPERFPALGLARAALRAGGGAPTVLNAANEVAVAAFLAGRIGFLDIARMVAEVLEAHPAIAPAGLADILALDHEARARASAVVARSAGAPSLAPEERWIR